jgi:large subunit ribosomal protein L23
MSLYRTIVRPIVTERTSAAYQDRGEYTFEVATDATKHSIKAAVEQLFGVKVTGVDRAPPPHQEGDREAA